MAYRQGGGKNQANLGDFRQALEQAAAELPALVVAHGECEYLRNAAVSRFRDAWLAAYPGGDISTIRAAGDRPANLSDVNAELAGGSLFSREKLVILRQADRMLFASAGQADGEEAESGASLKGNREKAFLAYLDQPAKRIWLVLESASLPRNRIVGKKIDAACFAIPCPQPAAREIPAWLSAKAGESGKRLDDEAADLLQRAHGQDLGILAGEVEKLALFAGGKERIDAAMAGEFLIGTIEFDIFSFTNAVEARNTVQAAFYARRIAMQGTRDQRGKKEGGEKSAHRVLAMLAGTVQNLLRARVALAAGLDPARFASAEKLSPWRAAKLLEAAAKFDLRELRRMVAFTADQVRRAHDTGGDALLALELMAVKLTKRGA